MAYREMTSDAQRKVLVVAGTHEEIGRITHAIREDMKQRGQLDRGVVFDCHSQLQWTEAQKKDLSNYQHGQVLSFHRSSRGINRHESLTVERADSTHITAKDLRGDGRTLPSSYREFDHRYAITAHRSQGKTVDGVILSADAMKQELFYVGASRGRSEIAIVTSDREQLRESLGFSSARPSATELAREQTHSRQSGHRIQQLPAQQIDSLLPRHEVSTCHDIGFIL